MKPSTLIHGTWTDAKEAAEWLGAQLAEYAPRFASDGDRDTSGLAAHAASAVERLTWGGDVALGYYLGHPLYLSLSLVTCSPNRTALDLSCPFSQVYADDTDG